MKIVVFSDIHGSVAAMDAAVDICKQERPNKIVFCGDLFGGVSSGAVAERLSQMDGVLYVIRGNNDRACHDSLVAGGLEDNAVMYHFGRTLFFTHGHKYNGWNIPPVLHENDVLVFGHTHFNSVTKRNGLYLANVGSLAQARDGQPSYMVLDETGITLKRPDGTEIYFLAWN